MQYLPFADAKALAVYDAFERRLSARECDVAGPADAGRHARCRPARGKSRSLFRPGSAAAHAPASSWQHRRRLRYPRRPRQLCFRSRQESLSNPGLHEFFPEPTRRSIHPSALVPVPGRSHDRDSCICDTRPPCRRCAAPRPAFPSPTEARCRHPRRRRRRRRLVGRVVRMSRIGHHDGSTALEDRRLRIARPRASRSRPPSVRPPNCPTGNSCRCRRQASRRCGKCTRWQQPGLAWRPRRHVRPGI